LPKFGIRPAKFREALRVNSRIAGAKRRKQTSRQVTLSGLVWLASNDQGDICNPTDQARRQEPKKFFLLQFFLPVWLSGRLPAQNASARAGQSFFDRLPEVRTPGSAVSDFVLEGRISGLGGGFADAGELL
jgi:hypothetical protein